MPGHDGLIRVNLPLTGGTASFDTPADLHFGHQLHPERPFDPQAWRDRIGEYSDGDISLVLGMWSDDTIGAPYPFYADLDHDVVVRLTPIAENRLLSEQGEEITFGDDGELRIAIDRSEATLLRTQSPAEEEVSFLVSGEATVLAGTLLRPAGDDPVPGVVLAHGSVPHQRDFYRTWAHAMVRAGVAALIFDRQGHGASTGEPRTGLRDNAAGIEAALDFLNTRDDISTVGLWGISNGMWTVPLVAARRPDVAFIAGTSASGVTMAEAEVHRRTTALAEGGVAPKAVKEAAEAWRLLFAMYAAGSGTGTQIVELEDLLAKLRAESTVRTFAVPEYAKHQPMLSPLPPLAPAGETAGKLGEANADMQYDPAGSYRVISCPVLLQFGADDPNIPGEASAERISAALEEGGNKDVTVSTYAGAGHLLESTDGEVVGMTREQATYGLHGVRLAPGVIGELIDWIRQRAEPAED
ncbi:MAG TPA: alpha/beta fold hydrolase [Stackebrandtia sp.]|jgi:pimeloyl-ACP methyl ester carboxylesterase|nr:alpha/beta fold hydrolase [Stackebrandtia sp.]